MNCSVKSFVPIRIGGPDATVAVAVGVVVGSSSPPPQPPSTTASAAMTASPSTRKAAISGARPGGRRRVGSVRALLHPRHREVEDAALAGAAGHPDAAAVLVDDALA